MIRLNKHLNICIIGGGNIGTLLCAEFAKQKNINVSLLTSKPEKWNNNLSVLAQDGTLKYTSPVKYITDSPKKVIPDADIIISTVPSHVFPVYVDKIKKFIAKDTWIGVIPGSGGKEFYIEELINKGCIFFGFQRVHAIARIKEYGFSVYELGRKTELFISSIPSTKALDICLFFESIFKIKCTPLPNYLNITLTPSNPILHTVRLYDLFKDFNQSSSWDKPIDFYSEWTDEASNLLIKCDEELQLLCSTLSKHKLSMVGVKSLKEHYESYTPQEMTNKIKNIAAFKGIKAPMICRGTKYIPDFNSRYFLEDFPFGLCIIKGFCLVANIPTPYIDKILDWYQRIRNTEYFVNHSLTENAKVLPLPQNFNIQSLEQIIDYYNR